MLRKVRAALLTLLGLAAFAAPVAVAATATPDTYFDMHGTVTATPDTYFDM